MERIVKELERIWSAIKENANAISQHAQIIDNNSEAVQRLIEQRQHDQQLDDTLKAVTTVYSNARAYNNLLIFAGYAAFFAMWGFLRNDIPRPASHWALLLILASATVFVLWEVAKMAWLGWQMQRNAKAMLKENPVAQIQALAPSEVREALIFGKVWVYVIVVTVVTGVAAIGVLAWNLVELVLWPAPS